MTVLNQVAQAVEKFDEGQLFTFSDIQLPTNQSYDLSKAVNKLIQRGAVRRLLKGVFYRPRETRFGPLRPSERQILDFVMPNKTSAQGYITGLRIYNQWGLTTQVSSQVVIATSNYRKPIKIGALTIKFVKGIAPETESDVEKLRMLDVLKNFKRIPDRDPTAFVKIITSRLKSFSTHDLTRLVELAEKYPPEPGPY